MKHACLLALVLLCAGCRDIVEARAAVGGPLSKPEVHAELTLHREWTLVWGETITYRFDVQVDRQKYRTEDVDTATAVRISPDRKTFAVHGARWHLYSLGSDQFAPGYLTLVEEGDPRDELEGPSNSLEPVPDYSFLQWVAVGGIASGIVFAVLRRRNRKLPSGA